MTLNPVETVAENNIFERFLSDPYIKNKVDAIKINDEALNENELKSSDIRRSNIMDIAEFLEMKLTQFGHDFLLPEISTYLRNHFEKTGLEKYTYLIYEVLPDKFKDKNKASYKAGVSKVLAKRAKRHIDELRHLDLAALDQVTIYDLKEQLIDIVDGFDQHSLTNEMPVSRDDSFMSLKDIENNNSHNPNLNELETLKDLEKNKFKKASIGEPLSDAEKLCKENPEYAALYPELVKTLDQMVKGMEIIKDWFTVRYPPLTVEHLKKLTHGFKLWNEYWRPYYDRKYRRDHNQLIKIAISRIQNTATKASHDSKIPSAHFIDRRTGQPIMRGLTKEQIDAIYVDEFNFWLELLKVAIPWKDEITEVNAAHGGRCGEDRAIALSETLSHHA